MYYEMCQDVSDMTRKETSLKKTVVTFYNSCLMEIISFLK